MTPKRLQVISFFLILLLAFLLAVWIIKPFAAIVAFAIILVILFQPINIRLRQRLGSENLAALLTLLIFLVIVFIPLAFFGQIIFNEAVHIVDRFRDGSLVIHRDQIIQSVPIEVRGVIENFSRDLNSFLNRISSSAFAGFSSLVSNVVNFFLSLAVLLFTMFYLLRDGEKIKKVLMDISPIAARQEHQLIDRIVLSVNGVVKGSFLTALVQGVVATIGFFIFGVSEPLLWGLFTVLAALVPTVGTSIALVPAVIYLLVTGHTGQAIGLTIWGAAAVGLIDNFVGPKLVGSRTQLHPVLVLLSVLGGIQLFGLLGFLIGPIVMAIFIALVEMYRTDFKSYVEQE